MHVKQTKFQGRRELSRSFYDDDTQPLVPDNEDAGNHESTDNRQEEPFDDDINDDVLRGIDYDEKKVDLKTQSHLIFVLKIFAHLGSSKPLITILHTLHCKNV